MRIARTAAQLHAALAQGARSRGFVPTMGALHDGHLSLITRARSESASVVASLFVNPLQFGPNEDLARYPRDVEADCEKLFAAGVDLLFLPSVDEMYPRDFATSIDVGPLATTFEGVIRPTHFRGVATVVAKLLNLVAPDTLYIGQKDAQQTAVLRRLVRDLSIATTVVIVETVREADGLAMSSRNLYLSDEQRAAAPSLQQSLVVLQTRLNVGDSKAVALETARAQLSPLGAWEYLDVVDADSFEPLDGLCASAFIIGAVRFGPTRLLDNLWIRG